MKHQLTGASGRLLTTGQAAELLAVNRRTISNWIERGLVPYVELPSGGYRIPLGGLLDSLGGSYDLAGALDATDKRIQEADVTEDDVIAALDRD